MAEIDDNELLQLRQAAEFVKRVSQLDDGEELIEDMAKRINPKVRTTKDTAEKYSKPVMDQIEKLAKRLDGWDEKVNTYNAGEQKKKIKQDFGFTDEGLESLEKFASERGIKSLDDAAVVWEKTNPSTPAKPSYMGSNFTMGELSGTDKSEDIKLLTENPQKFQDAQIRKFFDEKRNG